MTAAGDTYFHSNPPCGRLARWCLMFAVTLACAHPLASRAAEPEWSRFRGPNGSGHAPGSAPPITWSDAQNLKWKTELPGPGTSSPILAGNRIFLTCWTGYGATKAKSNLSRELL